MLKRKPRILLIQPPMVYHPLQSRKTAIFPMGLGYIAAVLEPDAEVKLFDAALEGFEQERPWGDGLVVYGSTHDQIADLTLDFKPDLVGISALFSSLHGQVIEVARAIKQAFSQAKVIVGGPHASALPEILLRETAVDYVGIGEGEKLMSELAMRLCDNEPFEGIMGLAGKNENGSIYGINTRARPLDINSLPMPARHLVSMDRYFQIGQVQGLRMEDKTEIRLAQMTTSRGCPEQCTFCGKCAVWGNKVRFASPQKVVDEIKHLIDRYQVNRIAFQDDNLTADRRRIEELLKKLITGKIPITWEAHNGLAAWTLDEKLLRMMKESGCVSFTIAVESGSEKILRRIKKKVDLDETLRIADTARSLCMDVRAFFIIGFPGETREEIEATRRFARKLGASVSAMALYTPLPGSQLWDELVEKKILDPNELDFSKLSFGAFQVQLSEVPVSELHKIRKVDWLLNTFADQNGKLKRHLSIEPSVIIKELKNGVTLYPDEESLTSLYKQAVDRYGSR